MTEPKPRQKCRRCGTQQEGMGRGVLCTNCKGKCRICGKPALLNSKGDFRSYCAKHRTTGERERSTQCGICGGALDGPDPHRCRACLRVYIKERYPHQRERRLKHNKEWRARNKTHLERKERRRTLQRYHGLTVEDYELMFNAQGGLCAICHRQGDEAGGVSKHLHVDHCHATGKIRGLLCNSCNNALGRVRDDPRLLLAMADYLEAHQQKEAA